MPRLFGLIPAAGHSRRMGRPKLALRLGDATVLERVCRTLQQAGVERTVVVVGPHGSELVALAESEGADVLQLASATDEMRQTIEHGLDWLERHCQPQPTDAWLLLPADHPVLEPAIIEQMQAARQRQYSIVVPTYQGKRGHPALIAWEHVAAMRRLPQDVGFNVYMRQHAAQTLELPVQTESVLWDLDTPDDYRRAGGIL